MPKYFLNVSISHANGHQTFSVKARSLKEAKRKFLAHESMVFVREEVEVEGLEDIEDSDLKEIYQE